MDDPAGAAGDGEGMWTDGRHVFVEGRSPVGEYWVDVRGYRNNLLGKVVNQAGKECCGVSRITVCHLRIKVSRDLFDGEKDRVDDAKVGFIVTEDNVVGSDLKDARSPQGGGGERRTDRGRPDPAESATLQTSI